MYIHTHIHTERQTDRDRDRQTDRQAERHICMHTYECTNTQRIHLFELCIFTVGKTVIPTEAKYISGATRFPPNNIKPHCLIQNLSTLKYIKEGLQPISDSSFAPLTNAKCRQRVFIGKYIN